MSRFLTFLTVVIVLAIVRAVLVALVVALVIMLLFSFVTRPRETLVFIGTLTLFGLASARPIACIVAIGIVVLAVVVMGAWQRHTPVRLLADEGEHHSQAGSRLGQDLRG